jgi:hypothetical protein
MMCRQTALFLRLLLKGNIICFCPKRAALFCVRHYKVVFLFSSGEGDYFAFVLKYTSSTAMSAGVTPEMRPACPMFMGFIWFSFVWASFRSPFTAA